MAYVGARRCMYVRINLLKGEYWAVVRKFREFRGKVQRERGGERFESISGLSMRHGEF